MSSAPSRQNLAYYPRSTDYIRHSASLGSESPVMDFCLIYEGPLKSKGTPRDKHPIRKQMHKQLADLWEKHPVLSIRKHHVHKASEWFGDQSKHDPSFFAEPDTTEVETLARKYNRHGFRFVPLVNTLYDLVCGLDILVLRHEMPGGVVYGGGDLDNRLKTLFDALRVPQNANEMTGFAPDQDEDPFYCLLEDDRLITDLKISTDWLLKPLRPEQHKNEVVLVIRVHVKAARPSFNNMDL